MSGIKIRNMLKLRLLTKLGLSVIVFSITLEICARIDDKLKYDAPFFGKYDAELLRMEDADGIRYNIPDSRFEKWQNNRFGFRGPDLTGGKPPNLKRIICMGTSETYGLYESPEMEWPAQLRTMLNANEFEVVNAAVVGLPMRKFIPYMEKYVLKFDPDILILIISPHSYTVGLERAAKAASRPATGAQTTSRSAGFSVSSLFGSPRIPAKIKQTLKQFLPLPLVKKYQIRQAIKKIRQSEARRLKGKRPMDIAPQSALKSFQVDMEKLVTYLTARNIDVIICSYPMLLSPDNIDDYPEIFLENRRFGV
ncbi:MAG: hypothetical protein JSV44_03740, partial [Candidatus Zixiibacteriota bacterium]